MEALFAAKALLHDLADADFKAEGFQLPAGKLELPERGAQGSAGRN